jgi:allophanate hydrolase subunit 1
MAKAKKITKKELTEINEQQHSMSQLLIAIGALEAQKSSAILQLRQLEQALEASKLKIEETYGPVNIDLKTGEYTVIEKKPELETV